MKKVIIALFLLAGTAYTQQATAQVSVNINIGNQPAWGPTGYDYVNFYYLPDINCYYDVVRGQFIYFNGNNWRYARTLPSRYRGVNLYNTYKVVVNRPTPYRYNQRDIRQYGRYKGNRSQPVIRDSRDSRYYASKQHPQHQQWVKTRQNSRPGTIGRGQQNNQGQINNRDNHKNRDNHNNRDNNNNKDRNPGGNNRGGDHSPRR